MEDTWFADDMLRTNKEFQKLVDEAVDLDLDDNATVNIGTFNAKEGYAGQRLERKQKWRRLYQGSICRKIDPIFNGKFVISSQNFPQGSMQSTQNTKSSTGSQETQTSMQNSEQE